MTLKQAFTQEMEPKARRVGELISPETQGRGLVAVPETASVKEFQSYWSYTPGTDIDGPKVPEGIRGPGEPTATPYLARSRNSTAGNGFAWKTRSSRLCPWPNCTP